VLGPICNAMSDLIGFLGEHRNHPVLGSTGAYEVAYWKLHEAVSALLPPPGPPSTVAEVAEVLPQQGRELAAVELPALQARSAGEREFAPPVVGPGGGGRDMWDRFRFDPFFLLYLVHLALLVLLAVWCFPAGK
jgi:hypothetical protein